MIRVLHFIKMKHHNFPEIKNTYLTFLQIYYRYAVAKLIQINIDFFFTNIRSTIELCYANLA